MLLNWIRLLLIQLWFPPGQKPVNDLHPKQNRRFHVNWTLILLLLVVVGFFVFIWTFKVGNEYPNELMSNI